MSISKVQERAFVEIDYVLTLDSGEEIDRSEEGEPLGFIFGVGQIIPGLEKAIEGMEKGKSASVVIEPEDGYGVRREELLEELPRENFPDDLELEPGMSFQATGPHGPISFVIEEIREEVIVADFNHPLADKRLNFEVTIKDVREATQDELDALKAHDSCGGHTCHGCGAH